MVVTFEIAEKLKEKGFRWVCLYRYNTYSKTLQPNQVKTKFAREVDYSEFYNCFNSYIDNNIDAPTISQVLEWLRREKNIYVSIFIDDDSDCPVTYEIYKGTECMRTHHGEYFTLKDWNKCKLRAIDYVLDNLI
jgi:hypothetical protein